MPRTKVMDAVIEGTEHKVLVPEDTPNELASSGVVLGPPMLKLKNAVPDYDSILASLQHELFARGVITYQDARRRTQDVFGALCYALQLDVDKIVEAYRET